MGTTALPGLHPQLAIPWPSQELQEGLNPPLNSHFYPLSAPFCLGSLSPFTARFLPADGPLYGLAEPTAHSQDEITAFLFHHYRPITGS